MKNHFLSFSGILISIMSYALFSNSIPNAAENNLTNNEVQLETENLDLNCTSFLALPFGFEDASSEEVEKFFSNDYIRLESQLQQSHQIKEFLSHIGKIDVVQQDMNKGDLYSDVDLSKYLSNKQIQDMSTFKVKEEKSMTAFACHDSKVWCYRRNCNGLSHTQIWWSCYLRMYYKTCTTRCGSGGPS